VLGHRGYRTLEAVTGEDGVALAREHLPALVLMDIQLPGIDGIEAFEQLAADSATKNIPVIAVTASAMQEERARIDDVGFAGYQPKPLRLKEFMAALEEVLSRGPQA
jgi:two-component system cell cycle response regulator DivK